MGVSKREAAMTEEAVEAQDLLPQKIAKILDEARLSNAAHNRKLKELCVLRSKSKSPLEFLTAFSKTLTPLFSFHRRITSAERVVRFISLFATARDANFDSHADEFLEEFLKFLLAGSCAANKSARFRACQIVSEIIMRLPDDAEVSNELWDEVVDHMKLRVQDKVPLIRMFAVRALSRFANDSENSDILDLFLEVLPMEQNAEVRKTVLLSLPPSNTTLQVIIDWTLDVSESVRKAAYCILANKFPLQSLSIKQRTIILQRGLADRSQAVSRECLKLMTDEWLTKCCHGNPVELLKYLDVETYERVGESVMGALLGANLLKLHDGESIRHYILTAGDGAEGIQLMEAEVSLYWRTICKHILTEAQEKGSDAAATMGTEAAVYAAEASDKNDLLEKILPATISDYVGLVKAHINAGSSYRFASRQLLLLGRMLDFSDAANRKIAGAFLREVLHMSPDHEVDDDGNLVVLGDGINLGGDRDWAVAVSGLVKKVHAAAGEFEEIILEVVEELARPCRERTANFIQWMHCLAVTSLLLENAKSLNFINGKVTGPAELLESILLPGAKHVHLDVQRISIRCLGLFGLLDKRPNEKVLKQLRHSFITGLTPISTMSCKALFDLVMWHGPQEVDKALGQDQSLQSSFDGTSFRSMNLSEADEDFNMGSLDLLYAGLDNDERYSPSATNEIESVQTIVAEGFAKILLLSENYPSIPASLHPPLLSKLLNIYFSSEKDLERLKQCLSVFFEHYPSLTVAHKRWISETFVPFMRSMWPGMNGNVGGSAVEVTNMRKQVVQASRFMLQMMQAPLYANDTERKYEDGCMGDQEVFDSIRKPPLECSEEGLAIRIAIEVASFRGKKTPAQKSYVSALCRLLVSLHFRPSEQGAIRLMRRLLCHVIETASSDKDLVKELKRIGEHLTAIDKQPDLEMLQDQAHLILDQLKLEFNFEAEVAQTPVPCSTRPARSRRRVKHESSSSDEAMSPTSVSIVAGTISTRSQRASKTVALTRITSSALKMNNVDEEDEEDDDEDDDSDDGDSDVTEN
ncbi:condensin complex subunit 3 isoform X2 [Momordica charantia]|uniref:Condensin complex subunit 3 isoform X2 n=1 Tax=Momordica charantia TaxID=3673 RepID=A0A6J1CIW0_MOMCH|nr:condensin complex subunit 3 isoform X2 [Momordica charantia]